jgi:hypothetical protein
VLNFDWQPFMPVHCQKQYNMIPMHSQHLVRCHAFSSAFQISIASLPGTLALTPPNMPKAQHTVASKAVCAALRSGGNLEDHMVKLSFWPMLMTPPVDSK